MRVQKLKSFFRPTARRIGLAKNPVQRCLGGIQRYALPSSITPTVFITMIDALEWMKEHSIDPALCRLVSDRIKGKYLNYCGSADSLCARLVADRIIPSVHVARAVPAMLASSVFWKALC